jgi:two-component system response regulator YesN
MGKHQRILREMFFPKGDVRMPFIQNEVLVVDDEPKQRRGLAAMIRSLRPEYRVHEAKNGKEAFELARSRSLDIVFTDIQMPVLNGIEFLEALNKEEASLPRVVFVSVFHEFEYAQRALRLGAKDYLVKPVSSEHLEALLANMEQQIDKESSRQTQARNLTDQLAHTRSVYLEHLLYKWMTEDLQASEADEVKSHFAADGSGTVLILKTKPGARMESETEWKCMLKRAVSQMLCPFAESLVIAPEHEKDRLYVALVWKPGVSGTEGLDKLRTALGQLGNIYSRSIGAGVGIETASLGRDIRKCCASAAAALEYLYYFPEGKWLCSNALENLLDKAVSVAVAAGDTDALDEAVTESDVELAVAKLDAILDNMAAAYPSPFRMKCHAIQLLLTCIKRAEPVLDKEVCRGLADRIDRELLASDSLRDTKETASRLLTDIVNQMKRDKSSRSEMIMQKCREYVEEHLQEDLGLELVAQRFFYNSSYFSILFKNHFQISFTDFLVKARMQKARCLLLQSDHRVADIAKQVGYKDIKYFNKVFKKMFLYSPEEFRRMFSS